MREIGRVVRLQIQRSSLKTGAKPDRVYDPAPLLSVPRLAVTTDGALGLGPDEAWVVDIHHRAHPATKNEDGQHGISVGFTTHYAAMQDRFGNRIAVGCAGENIIAEADRQLQYDDVKQGLAVLDASEREVLRLAVLQVAHPCRPFTGWALGRQVAPEALKEHLRFLDDGMRGYYCVAETAGIVSVGDRLVLL
jgi:MOSC domain-containing protein